MLLHMRMDATCAAWVEDGVAFPVRRSREPERYTPPTKMSQEISRRLARAIPFWLLVLSVSVSGQPRKVATISANVITQLTTLPLTHPSHFTGIRKMVGDSEAIWIVSNRAVIVFNHRRAKENGGRYTTPADLKADVVDITCGDADLGEQLDCSGLSVTDSNGKKVVPLSYGAGPRVYTNRLGNKWTVRRAFASFESRDLMRGFTVTASEANGTEWVLTVPPEDVHVELLLDLVDETSTVSSGPSPPAQLRVSIQPRYTGWSISGQNPGYTWRDCVATIGKSSIRLTALEPNAVVVVNREDFTPPVPNSDTTTPSVTCTAKGTKYSSSMP